MTRRTLANVGLAVASIAFTLAICELLARAFLPAPQQVTVESVAPRGPAPPAGRDERSRFLLSHHPEQGGVYVETKTGRRLRPNASILIRDHRLSRRPVGIETNSLGYRNREIGEKTGTRLLFLGDSITLGDYLNEEETFVRRIEALARADLRDWETINAGVGAIGLMNEIAILSETGIATHPDVVVLDFYLNDFQASPGIHVTRIPGWAKRSRLAHHLAMRFLRREVEPEIDVTGWREEFAARATFAEGDPARSEGAFDRVIWERFADWGGAWSEHAWERMEPLFGEFARLAERHGFRPFLVAFPVRAQVEAGFVRDYPQRQLARIADDLGIPMLDLLPALRSLDADSDEPLFYDHCHHTPLGNEVIARRIYAFLAAHLDAETGGRARSR